MRRVRTRAGLFLASAVLVACGVEENVSVGSAGTIADLNVCAGEGTDCDAPPAVPVAPPERSGRSCDGPTSAGFDVVFEVDLSPLFCGMDAECGRSFHSVDVGVADDDSVWVLGRIAGPVVAYQQWLAHVSADGSVLGTAFIAPHEVELAHQARMTVVGNAAFVIARNPEGTYSWLDRYEGAVEHTRRTELSFIRAPMLAAAPEGGIMVTGTLGESSQGILARVDADGDVVWTQRQAAVGFGGAFALDADDEGQATLVAAHVLDQIVPLEKGLRATRYDSAGNPVWSHVLEAAGEGTSRVQSDASGDVTVAWKRTAPDIQEDATWVQRLEGDGNERWLYRVGSHLNITLAVGPVSGSAFVVSSDGLEGDLDEGSILEISKDGETCVRHPYRAFNVDALATGASDQLTFITHRSVGRFAPRTP